MDAKSAVARSKVDPVTVRRALLTLLVAVVVGAVVFGVWGDAAGNGYLLGLSATGICIGGLWLAVSAFGKLYQDHPSHRGGMSIIVLALMVKLPYFVWAADRARSLPEPGPGGFLAGLALVYFALVWWVVAKR